MSVSALSPSHTLSKWVPPCDPLNMDPQACLMENPGHRVLLLSSSLAALRRSLFQLNLQDPPQTSLPFLTFQIQSDLPVTAF